ncbi:MAG TPA: alpha/beta hydrolase [Acidimicrobiales bacterium]|nr:alpha/beta hydrolase [Acidimicrobiales bacterium]
MSGDPSRPFDFLRSLAIQEVEVTPTFRHVEIYTLGGLLTLLWHGTRDETRCVVMGGGAMGGLLGPADGSYHDLGDAFASQGIGVIRVGYRQPNDLDECTLDMAAAVDLASRAGAERFVTVGHSFGGAIAVRTAIALPTMVAGVVTLATQSAGCEQAERLYGTPMLLIHGDRDEILPVMCSEVVNELAGGQGELVVLPGAGHLLNQSGAGDALRRKLLEWIPPVLAGA